MADISEYTKLIGEKAKGETVRDAIIDAIKIISGDTGSGKSATTLNGGPLEMYVVNRYDPQEGRPFAISLAKTKLNLKELVDKINYAGHEEIRPQTMTALGPIEKEGVNNSHYNQAEFDRLMTTRYQLYEAINNAWRNSPQGAHGSDEYLVLPTDLLEDYPEFIRRIGVGEGIVLRTEEKKDPIVENGTYSAPAGIGYSSVTVNVSSKKIGPLLEEISADGTYVAKDYNKDGFSFVTVQVPVVPPDDPSYDPEHPYDPGSWSGGGTPETGCTVVFYGKPGTKALYSTHVEYGGTAVYEGPTVTSTIAGEYWTKEWNPSPINVTHNMKCYAVFEEYRRPKDNEEIPDPWEVIATNRGARYAIGAYKELNFGKRPFWVNYVPYYPEDEEEPIYLPSNPTQLNIGRRLMVKVAGPDASNGTTSTWITREPIYLPDVFGSTKSREEMLSKLKAHAAKAKAGEDSSVSIGYLDSDLKPFFDALDEDRDSEWKFPSALKGYMKTVTRKFGAQEFIYSEGSHSKKQRIQEIDCKWFAISLNELYVETEDWPNFIDYYFPTSDKTLSGFRYRLTEYEPKNNTSYASCPAYPNIAPWCSRPANYNTRVGFRDIKDGSIYYDSSGQISSFSLYGQSLFSNTSKATALTASDRLLSYSASGESSFYGPWTSQLYSYAYLIGFSF